ncbi:unnamed protein product [Rotaria socialis]|uniref:Uncharacterized protein n=4 Tax=Rotaria socialis TaxID=392032 RepID=A0A817MWX1_9BILA|nr:unnamed protein product [Rotaria socialis]CAF4286194.1 unnamed protein product [Rotaria socialis]
MVATTVTKVTSASVPTNNHFMPSFKMDLPGNLLHPVILWTKDDVQKWIEYCMDEYSLEDINLNDFEMNGKALLLLNEDSFKQRSSRSGDILHKALQQHNALIKSLTCQVFPYQFWGNIGLFPPASLRHFNIPFPPPPPPSAPAPAPVPYMHPNVNYMFDRCEKKHETNFTKLQQPTKTRQLSNSSSSSISKSFEQNNVYVPMSSMKQEYIDHIDRQDLNVKQCENVSCQSVTSSAPFVSEQVHEANPIKFHSQLVSKLKRQIDDLTDMSGSDTTKTIRYYHDRVDFHGDILMKPPGARNCRILWEFLYILLEDPSYESIIHWENREKMIFRIVQADKLAALWGLQKNRLSMTYEKLSRGMRYYYSNNIITKEQSKRLLYRFMRSPDEIRKTIKRNVDTANTTHSTINKKPSVSLSSTSNLHRQETSNEMTNRFLQIFSVHSPSSTPATPNFNSANSPFFTTPNDSASKSDRSSSSSPVSFDSNNDNEKKFCSSSQSSSLTSTKRKQAVPISLNNCLTHSYSVDQPLNLVVQKQEEKTFNYKKQKFIYTSSNI